MRTFVLALLLAVPTISFSQAFDVAPVASGVPVVVAPPAPPAPPAATEAVATPAAPPAWAQDVMVAAQKLPVVGPLVTKALLWLGIMSSLLTALVAFVLGALRTLSGALKLSGLLNAAAAVADFQNGKVMYWLKYLSMFNAKTPPAPADVKSA